MDEYCLMRNTVHFVAFKNKGLSFIIPYPAMKIPCSSVMQATDKTHKFTLIRLISFPV